MYIFNKNIKIGVKIALLYPHLSCFSHQTSAFSLHPFRITIKKVLDNYAVKNHSFNPKIV